MSKSRSKDILRDYSISRCVDLPRKQQHFVEALLATRPKTGWPVVGAAAPQTVEWYVTL